MTNGANDEPQADRTRIDLGCKHDVIYWSKTLGLSRMQLAEVIKKVGNSSAAVRREVRR
jgi:hypothetical protein